MHRDLLNRIQVFLARHELYRGAPATEAQLSRATVQLGLRLDEDYREFISRFGAATSASRSMASTTARCSPPRT